MQVSKITQRVLLIILTAGFIFLGILLYKNILGESISTILLKNNLKEIESRDEQVDMIFVGGSRIYRSFDPEYFEDELGVDNAINIATPAQRPSLTYSILSDYLDRYSPKYAVIGITYNGMNYSQSPSTAAMAASRMDIQSQIDFLTDEFGTIEGLMIAAGKTEGLANQKPKTIVRNIARTVDAKAIDADTKNQLYRYNGFVGAHAACEIGGITKNSLKTEYFDVNEIDYTYYDKMIELCKSKGVTPFLVSGECSMMNLYRIEDYQEIVDAFISYAKSKGVKYFNVNYLLNREEIFTDDMFVDHLHLNLKGGEKISEIFAKVLREHVEGKDTSIYFYDDFDELDKDVKRVVSCFAEASVTNGNLNLKALALHSKRNTVKYRVVAMLDGEEVVLSSWTAESEFSFSIDEISKYETIRVEAISSEDAENAAFDEFVVKDVING